MLYNKIKIMMQDKMRKDIEIERIGRIARELVEQQEISKMNKKLDKLEREREKNQRENQTELDERVEEQQRIMIRTQKERDPQEEKTQ